MPVPGKGQRCSLDAVQDSAVTLCPKTVLSPPLRSQAGVMPLQGLAALLGGLSLSWPLPSRAGDLLPRVSRSGGFPGRARLSRRSFCTKGSTSRFPFSERCLLWEV